MKKLKNNAPTVGIYFRWILGYVHTVERRHDIKKCKKILDKND